VHAVSVEAETDFASESNSYRRSIQRCRFEAPGKEVAKPLRGNLDYWSHERGCLDNDLSVSAVQSGEPS
jgi:hypothetical protein